MARRTWYRLDNIGKFYSSQAGRSSQTVFRYSAELADGIDPDILQHALDHAIAQFPSFNVHLLNGMFWHYLEQSDGRPLVEPEHLPICSRLHYGPKSMLFRVSYFRNRVNLESRTSFGRSRRHQPVQVAAARLHRRAIRRAGRAFGLRRFG